MRSHRQVAEHLDATGLPVTYLAPSWYMENLVDAADTIRDEGTIFAPAGRGKVGFIAAKDVAHVAAEVLTSDGHEDATYVLTGPEALSYADVAARISAVFAREVDYENQPRGEARKRLLASGLTPWQAEGTLEMFDWIRHGAAGTVTGTAREVTGTAARSRTGCRSGAVPSSGGRRVCPHQPCSRSSPPGRSRPRPEPSAQRGAPTMGTRAVRNCPRGRDRRPVITSRTALTSVRVRG